MLTARLGFAWIRKWKGKGRRVDYSFGGWAGMEMGNVA